MAIDLTLRSVKGTPLTHGELDGNFTRLKQEFTDLATANSAVLVGGVQAQYLAQRRVDIRAFGIVFDGSDEGAKLRTALAAGVPLYFPPNKTITVGGDPAAPISDAGTNSFTRCIAIPSNADLMFGSNFTIKAVNGLKVWNRIVVMENVSNIKIYGTLKVDANVQNVGTPNNEHMHGIFLYNVTNLEADCFSSINARGDNVFIGGANETTFSDNIRIRNVIGTTAGRKNLVIHMVDNLVIDSANLNNDSGGASLYGGVADDSDKHCLDLEPDAFTGSRVFRQYIGTLRTRGSGNDFTAGTAPATSDAWQLTIGDFYHRNTGSSTIKAWIQYGVTINVVNNLELVDCFGADSTVTLQYAARLNVGGKLKINGSTATGSGSMIFATAAGGDANTPRLSAKEIDISCSQGGGLLLRSCHLNVDTLRLACPAYGFVIGDNVSTAANKALTNIGKLVTKDTGGTYIGQLDTPVTASPYVSVGEVTAIDTRGTKASAIFQVAANNSLNFVVEDLRETSGIPFVTWVGSDKFVKSSAYKFVCQGTPESMITAPVGAIAQRLDGGASTTLYVKQTGTGNTGWVGK